MKKPRMSASRPSRLTGSPGTIPNAPAAAPSASANVDGLAFPGPLSLYGGSILVADYSSRDAILRLGAGDALRLEAVGDINLANLNENILPSRERANVVLRKRADHLIGEVWLRQI